MKRKKTPPEDLKKFRAVALSLGINYYTFRSRMVRHGFKKAVAMGGPKANGVKVYQSRQKYYRREVGADRIERTAKEWAQHLCLCVGMDNFSRVARERGIEKAIDMAIASIDGTTQKGKTRIMESGLKDGVNIKETYAVARIPPPKREPEYGIKSIIGMRP